MSDIWRNGVFSFMFFFFFPKFTPTRSTLPSGRCIFSPTVSTFLKHKYIIMIQFKQAANMSNFFISSSIMKKPEWTIPEKIQTRAVQVGWFQDIQFSGVLRKSIQKLQEPVEKGVELIRERQSHCHYYQFPSLGYSRKTPKLQTDGLLKTWSFQGY